MALPTAPTITTTITLPVSHSGTASVCRAEIACSHICACNSGEVREHCGTTRAARKEAWVFSHSPPRIKCILQFQWRMGEKHRHYCRGAIGPAPPEVTRRSPGDSPWRQASPIPRIGRDDPDRKPSFCPNRLSKSARV